jgi:hypothetical protein
MVDLIKAEDSDPTQDSDLLVDESEQTVTATANTYEDNIASLSLPSGAKVISTSVNAAPVTAANSDSLGVHSSLDGSNNLQVDIANDSGAEVDYEVQIRAVYLR